MSEVLGGTRLLVIGHKGASARAPENTLASFRLALELGADGIEVDVRATADGVPVLIHDATVDRTTNGHGAIDALSLAEVRQLDACFGLDAYRGEPIPTVEELLTLVSGQGLLILEYKSLAAVAPSASLVRGAGAAAWSTAWSFQPQILSALRDVIPELSRTLLLGSPEDWQDRLEQARELGCIGLSLRQDLVAASHVESARGRGLKLYAWTANEPSDWRRLVAAGVDAIVTDDPGELLAFLGWPPNQ